MSDPIKHECGIALLRLLKPLDYYRRKYGSVFYGIQKLSLLMEKQHNRGQDGAGISCLKFDTPAGLPYYSRSRSNASAPIKEIFDKVNRDLESFTADNHERMADISYVKNSVEFCGELYLGHVRYGTFGKNNLDACHPFVRESTCRPRTLLMAGNFNLTNVRYLFQRLVESGHHLTHFSDGMVMLHMLGHFLEQENNALVAEECPTHTDMLSTVKDCEAKLDIGSIVSNGCKNWDGGFVVSGMFGNGDSFAVRDPNGIRTAYYYVNDEIAVVASERPPIQTAFNVPAEEIHELPPGAAIIIKKDSSVTVKQCLEPKKLSACSFERIYFSRGNDADIYQERKSLGRSLAPAVLDAVDHDIENTVFSFIPNTAEIGYLGLKEGLMDYCQQKQFELIKQLDPNDHEGLNKILSMRIRGEKIAVKDAKLRTFIADNINRKELIGHVYDTTAGVVRPNIDNLVVLDDSIVRGATLRDSILRMLDRLKPKRLVVVSTAPPICFPDCYGIDMATLGEFVAFEAAVRLLKNREEGSFLTDLFLQAKEQLTLPDDQQVNVVKQLYARFTPQELSDEIAEILRPDDLHAELKIIYQSIDGLHECCPNHLGDWYFSGDYPTPGGNRVVNQAFVNYISGVTTRAY